MNEQKITVTNKKQFIAALYCVPCVFSIITDTVLSGKFNDSYNMYRYEYPPTFITLVRESGISEYLFNWYAMNMDGKGQARLNKIIKKVKQIPAKELLL